MTDEFATHPELVQKRAQTIFVTRLAIGILIVFGVVTLVLLSTNAILSMSSRKALLDCSQPHGECYEQNRRQTSIYLQELVDRLTTSGEQRARITRKFIERATYCNNELPDGTAPEDFRKCIKEGMK